MVTHSTVVKDPDNWGYEIGPGLKEFIQDQWAPLAHIPDLAERPRAAGDWVPTVDLRRLAAYRVLASYRENVRRFFLPNNLWVKDADSTKAPAEQIREYGRGFHLVVTMRSLLLGDEQTIDIPALSDLDENSAQARELTAALEWFQAWADKERFPQKLLEGEEHSIGDGDGVYVLGWSELKQRPVLRVYDPGFYFPDLTDLDGWDSDEFPHTVHVAWEHEVDGEKYVRRHTWQMRRLVFPARTPWGGSREWTCWKRTVDYPHARLLPDVDVYSPELTRRNDAVIVQDWTDTGLDFIPIVHVPNDPATQRHFGRSGLLMLAQILDDFAGNDTDLAAVAAASAPILTHDIEEAVIPGVPGTTLQGSASFTDPSKNLTALRDFDEHLTSVMQLVSRLPSALVGQTDPSDVPSGYALQLGFHPARQLLREMRIVRAEKYPLILKFAYRIAQTAGVLPEGETPTATVVLGASLPSDRAATVDEVKALLVAGAISRRTAVGMLQTVGFPVEDAEVEVAAIERERFEEARQLVEATGDVDAARERLGLPALRELVLPEPNE